MKKTILYTTVLVLLFSCNKITSQLPAVNVEPYLLVLTASHSGSDAVEVLFRQKVFAKHDTIEVSVRNIRGEAIRSVTIMLEMCSGNTYNYDSCYLQTATTVSEAIKSNEESGVIFTIADKKIDLKSELINVSIINITYENSKSEPHEFSGVYTGGILRFVDTGYISIRDTTYENANGGDSIVQLIDTSKLLRHYGDMKGYIDIDGRYVFHIKGQGDTLYNATGRFIDADNIVDGLIRKDDNTKSIATLAPQTNINNIYEDSNAKIRFSWYLEKPLGQSSIDSISVTATKN